MSDSDESLVSVFSTDDQARVPLAEIALKNAGIAYLVREGTRGADTMSWTLTLPPTIRPRVIKILVAPDAAGLARELLADLEDEPSAPASAPDVIFEAATPSSTSIQIEDASTGISIGAISENELQELTTHLEEQSPQHYFVDRAALDTLEHARAEAGLVKLLRQAVGDGDGLSVRWTVR